MTSKMLKVRNIKGEWKDLNPNDIDKVVFTPFAYFNIFLTNGRSFSADKLNASNDD